MSAPKYKENDCVEIKYRTRIETWRVVVVETHGYDCKNTDGIKKSFGIDYLDMGSSLIPYSEFVSNYLCMISWDNIAKRTNVFENVERYKNRWESKNRDCQFEDTETLINFIDYWKYFINKLKYLRTGFHDTDFIVRRLKKSLDENGIKDAFELDAYVIKELNKLRNDDR